MKSLRCLLILSLERFIFIFITFIVAVGSKTKSTTATTIIAKTAPATAPATASTIVDDDNKGKFCADARDSYHKPPLVNCFVGVRPLVCHCDLQQTFEYK